MVDYDELRRQMVRHYEEEMRTALSDLRCPTHGDAPDIVLEGDTLDTAKWNIRKPCCDDLRDISRARIAETHRGNSGSPLA